MMERTAEASPQLKARIASALVLTSASGRAVANLIATACYVAVTVFFYGRGS